MQGDIHMVPRPKEVKALENYCLQVFFENLASNWTYIRKKNFIEGVFLPLVAKDSLPWSIAVGA